MPRPLLLAFALLCALVAPQVATATESVSLATVAPKNSIWGNVFSVWEKAVTKKTDGKLELKIYFNGVQGDDGAVVGKLKAGQLDAAAVSSIGLAQIHKPVLALQMPGLFRTWEAIDKGRNAVAAEFDAAFEKEGFRVAWGDLGRMRGMSKGFAVRRPKDLKGKKVLGWRNDVIGPVVYQIVPGASIVSLGPTEVLPTLRTGGLDVMTAPTLAAEQLQWTPHFDHISKEATLMAIGGVVWRKKRLDALPGDLRTILEDTGKIAQGAIKKKVRDEDDAVLERMKKKMTVVELTDDEQKEWRELFVKVGERLKQGTFEPKLVDKLVAAAE